MDHSHKLLLTLAGTLMACALWAQPAEKRIHRITAAQAVEIALKQRAEMLNARIDVENQKAYNREITGLALPQVRTSFSMARNFNIPVTVLPDFISPSVYNVLENEGVRDGNGDPIKWDGVINTFPAQFGVPWQATLMASIQQVIFQPDVFIALKARAGALELYQNQLKIAEDSVKFNVYNAYFGVLVAQKGFQFAKESQLRLQQLLKEQEQLFKNGFIEKLDLEKTQVNLNNITTSVINLENTITRSYAGLKLALAIPQTDSLHLADDLTDEWVKEDILSMGDGFDHTDRNEIKTLLSSEELLRLQVKRYRMAALPAVSAQWNVGTSAQRQKFNFFDTRDRWFYSNVLGLNISIPITDGWQRHNKVKQAQYELDKTRNSMDQFKQVIDFEIINARTTLTNALVALKNQEENRVLAEKVYNTTRIKYQQGLGSSFEVLQSETDLQGSLSAYYQALYNAGIARIAYFRALGKL
ncbi:MAG TPA: TolC family protein [Phnomibacter sp.]|nr:TolC family protein [Phnomibacter sp.]